MKPRALLIVLAVMTAALSCDQKGGGSSPGPREALVSKGFIDDNSYSIVCRGYPAEGAAGVQKTESAKRAALLGAYYIAQEVFTEAVAPDRDGAVKKIEYREDHVVLHYVIAKRGLKQMARTSPRTVIKKDTPAETKTDAAKEAGTDGAAGTEAAPPTE